MSLLPTAHAGQSFGARRIDFYTVSGEVSASDDGTGRVTDTDGMAHDVHLLERSNALAPGDTASVLRVQAGPNRRSRPAAIVNHTRGTWMRASPDATGLLARSGVTRGFNWWLSVLALALVAIAAVWPAIHGFLTEVNGNLMASIPAFDVYAEIAAFLPGLSGWRLETALPAGLLDGLASLGFIPMDQLTEWGIGIGAGLLALLSFLGRSWRLVYIPALAALALATGAILGAALPTLAVIGGSLLLFMLGGLINRVRDGGRFNARVARLAEHALRNPPQEGVRTSDTSDATKAGVIASAAIAAATATAEGSDAPAAAEVSDAPTEASAETESAPEASNDSSSDTPDTVETAQDEGGSGEVEAPAQDDLLPAAPTSDAETDIAADAAEIVATDEVDLASDTTSNTASDTAADAAVTVADETASDAAADAAATDETVAANDQAADAAAASDAGIGTDTAADEPVAEVTETASSEVLAAPVISPVSEADATDAVAGEDAPVEAESEAAPEMSSDPAGEVGSDSPTADPVADEVELDDDLPSLDDVAAAAALTAVETSEPETGETAHAEASPAAVDLDDERTMPVAPPPPMPGDEAASADAATQTDVAPEAAADPEPAIEAADAPEPVAEMTEAVAEVAAEVADAPEAVAEVAAEVSDIPATAIVDDPLMDGAADPMMSSEGKADYAPGAPDIEVDRTPVGQD
ncbi:hypothetical protein [Maricaulis sp.]|uniref:hypothetical protein n=1 Tax=Maricaulis sp. TaxID=1486257 RepID=UPI002618AAC2|nr:hypothetical protein [Maricaulis sp.]MDF1769939.1 hypothetical protein [Maricaulis sp.]